MNTLEQRCKNFLRELGVPVSQFCVRIKLSTSFLYAWLRGDRKISQASADRIDQYLSKYGF